MTSRKYDLKLEQLEREMNKTEQYIRRDAIEITGIGQDVQDDEIENKTLETLKAASVKLGKSTRLQWTSKLLIVKGEKVSLLLSLSIGNSPTLL